MLIALGATASALALLALYTWRLRRRSHAVELARRKAVADVESLHNVFSRFVPSGVVDELVGRGVTVGAEKKEVTVLFADLKDFTRMSETLDPATLVELLNGYFRAASSAITEHHGRVSKFMGDGLMALFGDLEPNPWQARDAVNAALAMREAVQGYNRDLAERGQPTLAVGVGIHQGVVVAGVVGSPQLMEYTVLGDVVNVAARVESLTRQHGVDILVTEPVRSRLDATYRCAELPPTPVKGKRERLLTFSVESKSDAPAKG